ncbi:MAG: hypothetical protein INF52_02795, partial [Rhodobacter sp.]|nr:hypothetical protein [Rhodobacter sp.]
MAGGTKTALYVATTGELDGAVNVVGGVFDGTTKSSDGYTYTIHAHWAHDVSAPIVYTPLHFATYSAKGLEASYIGPNNLNDDDAMISVATFAGVNLTKGISINANGSAYDSCIKSEGGYTLNAASLGVKLSENLSAWLSNKFKSWFASGVGFSISGVVNVTSTKSCDDPPPAPTTPAGWRWSDPLVVDLDGDGIELTSLEASRASFDLNIDGLAERCGWVGSDDALLALDVNGNGRIDDRSELFSEGGNHQNGFSMLSTHDSNSDGRIDAQDSIFSQLVIWQDSDGDGWTDQGELKNLAAVGIKSIGLNAQQVNETRAGNIVAQRSSVIFQDGSARAIEDVWFSRCAVRTIRRYDENYSYDDSVFDLPLLRGAGNVSHSWYEYNENPALRQMAYALLDRLEAMDFHGYRAAFNDFVFAWARSDDVEPGELISGFDARVVGFLNSMYGEDITAGWRGEDASHQDALMTFFNGYVDVLAAQFISQAANAIASRAEQTLESGWLQWSNSPLSALASLEHVIAHNPGDVTTELTATLGALAGFIVSGKVTVEEAVDALAIVAPGLAESTAAFIQFLDQASVDAGIDTASEFALALKRIGNDTIIGTSSDDSINAVAGSDYVDGGDGRDTIAGGSGADTLSGSAGNDRLDGGADNDSLSGGAGDDTLDGGAGADRLDGGEGNNTYRFGRDDGVDVISAQDWTSAKKNVLELKAGVALADLRAVRVGDDLVLSIAGTTDSVTLQYYFYSAAWSPIQEVRLSTGAVVSMDTLVQLTFGGTAAADRMDGTALADVMMGLAGNDTLYGNACNDTLDGGADHDYLSGGEGADSLTGGLGDDQLMGNAGDDTLDGGAGADRLDGGEGNNTYRFGHGDGADVISAQDWTSAKKNVLELKAGVAQADLRA